METKEGSLTRATEVRKLMASVTYFGSIVSIEQRRKPAID